ncbi:MAG: hypothetical protein JWO45_1615 [Spartobacteria bacterium]|nr:hypothetical protein [Spartobacteria bacterium]
MMLNKTKLTWTPFNVLIMPLMAFASSMPMASCLGSSNTVFCAKIKPISVSAHDTLRTIDQVTEQAAALGELCR